MTTSSGGAWGRRQTTRATDTALCRRRPAARAYPLEPFAVQSSEYAEQSRDDDACRKLWVAVLYRTQLDLEYLERFRERCHLQKHELERLRRIDEWCPAAFVRGSWFDDVCGFVGIEEEKARNWLGELPVTVVLPKAPRPVIVETRARFGSSLRRESQRSRRVSAAVRVAQEPGDHYDTSGRSYHDGPDGDLHEGSVAGCPECGSG